MYVRENGGKIMLKQGLRIIAGIIVLVGVTAAVTQDCLPKLEFMSAVGGFMVSESVLYSKNGQEGKLVTELFGGKEYIAVADTRTWQENLVWKENDAQKKVIAEHQEPLIGDVEITEENEKVVQSLAAIPRKNNKLVEQLKENQDTNFLWKNFYIEK